MRTITIITCMLVVAFSLPFLHQSQASNDNYIEELYDGELLTGFIEEAYVTSIQEQCLIETIYFESRGEPFLGQVAVGVVVMRRVQSANFPDDICAVVHAGRYWKGNPIRNQCSFSYFCDGKAETIFDEQGYLTAQDAAALVLMGVVVDNMEEVVYYHATYVNPRWSSQKKKVFQIGKHIFYKER